MVSEFEELSNIDVHTELEEALGRKILIKHDAKLSAYAEWHCAEEIKGIDRGVWLLYVPEDMGLDADLL